MKLPESIQRLCYRYHADRLDTEHHRSIIIPSVLDQGGVEDWDWLFATYGWDAIAGWIAEPANRELLAPAMARFWSIILLGIDQKPDRWSGPCRMVPAGALPEWLPAELR